MLSDHAGLNSLSIPLRRPIIRSRLSRAFVLIAAMAFIHMTSSQSCAQTLNLGAAGGFELFAAYNSSTDDSGTFKSSPTSTIFGHVGLGADGALGGSFAIGGNVYQESTAHNTTSGTPSPIVTDLSAASQAAVNAAQTAGSWNVLNSNVLTMALSGNNYQVNGSSDFSGRNVINLASNSGGIGSTDGHYTLTINGTASEQFVFNVGKNDDFTNVSVVLTGGVTGNNVFFNMVGGSNAFIASDITGTILNMNGKGISLDSGTYIHGAVISDGFVDMGNVIVAPELPTVVMASLAGLVVFGSAGIRRLRKRKQIALTVSPLRP
jgi:hypothetical protein